MSALNERIHKLTGWTVTGHQRLHGGMIADVWLLTMHNGQRFVAKTADLPTAMLGREGYMLRYLRQHSQLPVPDVIHSDDTLLLLAFVEGRSIFNPQAQQHAADLLAALHSIQGKAFGLDQDTLIGGLHQPNPFTESWVSFFRDHRLLYMADVAYKAGNLPSKTRMRLDKLAVKLPDLIDEPDAPALLHGDVWTTNVLAENGRITAFLDPAVYYGHPEIELAFITLFNTFDMTFFQRYTQHRPIANGFWESRRDVYNLYPLLVHVRLFGGGYVSNVKHILSKFGA